MFANVAACRVMAGLPADAPAAEALAHPAVRERVRSGLLAMRELGSGSSTHAARALLMDEPPSVDAGEITDKGYINQSAVLARLYGFLADHRQGLSRIGLTGLFGRYVDWLARRAVRLGKRIARPVCQVTAIPFSASASR